MQMNAKSICDFCQAPVDSSDFERGNAVKVLGRTYCQACMEKSIQRSRNRNDSVSEDLLTPKPGPLNPRSP
jgi:hypothetical protein